MPRALLVFLPALRVAILPSLVLLAAAQVAPTHLEMSLTGLRTLVPERPPPPFPNGDTDPGRRDLPSQ